MKAQTISRKRVLGKLTLKQTQAAVASVTKNDNGGVIQSIMGILKVAKKQKHPVSTTEITEVLGGMFPDRDAAGMRTTVRVQLSRLPKERKFGIARVRSGRDVRYTAA